MPYSHFTQNERNDLQMMKAVDVSVKDIAACLGKHRSSIYRELNRNRAQSNRYISHIAHNMATKRRHEASPAPKTGDPELMSVVVSRLKKKHSPEQIAGRLKLEYPENKSMHISHESIYKMIYAILSSQPELKDHLRHGRRKRKKRSNKKDNRGIIPNRKFIDERPKIVDKKTRFGDWEGDTVEGGNKKEYFLTFAERKTKVLIARKIKHKSAGAVYYGTCDAFKNIPGKLLKTITVDNGKEFAMHEKISKSISVSIFFAHPYHSWERGLNEHTNGLLRQYFPKGSDFTKVTQKKLDRAVDEINNRPRKSLGFRTPNEVMQKKLVALQT